MIHLREMNEKEYENYYAWAVPTFAREKMQAEGMSETEAMKHSMISFRTLLPDGLKTEDHYLYQIIEDQTNASAGVIWFAKDIKAGKARAYIYDFELKQSFRGKGYGRKAMELLEEKVRLLALPSIGLHVFAHNKIAHGLYEKLGYKATNIVMSKDLSY